MRHHNPISQSFFSHRRPERVYSPYCTQYIDAYVNSGFESATSKKRYVQILQYVADHDGCKRIDILRDVFKQDVSKRDRYYSKMRECRGYASSIFSQLLYLDMIDYDKHYCYHITDKGREILKIAYLNDMAKIVKC